MENTNNIVLHPDTKIMQRHWGWFLGFGILLLIFGIIGLGMDIFLTIVSMYFFAALLMISGLSHFADAFKHKEWKGTVWQILVAILYLIGAGIVLYDPLLASTIITALLAWTLIVIGVVRISMSVSLRNTKGWVWILFAGICSLILGILILLHWPISGLWVIGLFIAIDMIISGWTYIFIAISLRRTKSL
ncbi:HdeD family acid-resistance protein [Legionella bozemanae]|uniref:Acid-resistance membrane protein n=1 Tax=Legionella bozemanae TaxID=447 RepID=A0A0W0RJX5_LEGBO|nr:HdeD family acid-resistance protein [Legionella bozemanae]KTC71364.1 acid-resistance membrane protein [Legionella bozemanae]STO35410.1 acid-resistance membrane protein [Legionella bozemanae]